MPDWKFCGGTDLLLFLAQVIVVYLEVSISLFNLPRGDTNKELWISLLSSSVGYLLPYPILKRKTPE